MTNCVFPQIDESRATQILVVEDERIVARDIKACLENLGYVVPAIACSGEEAIVKAKAIRPDVVLMDIRLEGEMDGTQAAQQIWHDLQIPIIYSSGYSDQATVERATATEPFGYILKPIKERDLYVAVTTALQRYQLETKLKRQADWLTLILRAIGDGVIVVDTQNRIKFLNVAAELMTGWQQEEVIDQPLPEIFKLVHEQTQQPVPNPVSQALQTGKTAYLKESTLLMTRSGKTIPIADSAAPFQNDKSETAGVVLVFRDITEQRLAAEQALTLQRAQMLERQMEELQRLNHLKNDFLSTISHELRTPLSSIKLAIEILEMTLDQRTTIDTHQSSTISRYLQVLRDQCNQELSLVNDLLELQHLDTESCPLKLTAIEVCNWISHIIEIFEESAQRHQQRLEAILPPNLPILVSDLAILNRVLMELLTNAHKYTPPDEHITVSDYLQDENYLHLRVSNTGVEVPSDELTRIFDNFYRIPTEDRWQQGGTGLGLALVKKMVAHIGGSIWAESGSGQTSFIVQLPLTLPNNFQ